jgi:hypothetical protein
MCSYGKLTAHISRCFHENTRKRVLVKFIDIDVLNNETNRNYLHAGRLLPPGSLLVLVSDRD